MNTFESTLTFNEKMRKPAHVILEKCFRQEYGNPNLTIESINDLYLDQNASIDTKISFSKSKVTFAVQEKYRTNTNLSHMDFTQELYNAYGTDKQSNGEFFHLYAEYYFYGWANENETDFAEWFIMEIATYKKLVLKAGSLSLIPESKQFQNNAFGKSLFYAIPLVFLAPAIIYSSNKVHDLINGII